MQDPYEIWLQKLEALQRNTDVEWRNTITSEMQKDTILQETEEESLRKLFEDAMGRSDAVVSMQVQKLIVVAPSDPTADNIPDRCKCYVEIRGDWVRPASVDPDDPKLWSKLASALVRDTIDSTMVVISTDPRRTAKASGGRKVEMYCRCAGKNKAKEGRRKARKLKAKAPAPGVAMGEGLADHPVLYGTSLFEGSPYAQPHPLVIDATGHQDVLGHDGRQQHHHHHQQEAHEAHMLHNSGMGPEGLADQSPMTHGLEMHDEQDVDDDKLESDERATMLMNKCLARAILLLDVMDDRSSGSFILKIHVMHTHRCKHIVVGHARKEVDHSRTFMDSLINVLDTISKSLRKRQPDSDLIEATRRMRARVCLPRGPLNQSKLVHFMRQFSDPELIKQVPQMRPQYLGMTADGMHLEDPTAQHGQLLMQNRRRKRSGSNIYQENYADMYSQESRRPRSNSASSGGMLTAQMQHQMGLPAALLVGMQDSVGGHMPDTILDDPHMQQHHMIPHQMDRDPQDPNLNLIWSLLNSPQLQATAQASGQPMQPMIEALRRSQGNPQQLTMLSSLLGVPHIPMQPQNFDDPQFATMVADSLYKTSTQQYAQDPVQDMTHGWMGTYPTQMRADERHLSHDDQGHSANKSPEHDPNIVESTPV